MSQTPQPTSSGPHWFATTHWSVVIAAGQDDSRAQVALAKLCQTYWYPLYAFVRRMGYGAHDVEDLIQSFFAVSLEKNYWNSADREKGRFRSFLLVALKRFLANEWDKMHTQKRGGGVAFLALDGLKAEERYAIEPVDELAPDKLYDRRWAMTLLETVLKRLEEEQAKAGRAEAFQQLKGALTSSGHGLSYAEIGRRLGMSEGAVKVAVHRLRKQYQELLREEISQTVASPEQVEEERRELLAALSG